MTGHTTGIALAKEETVPRAFLSHHAVGHGERDRRCPVVAQRAVDEFDAKHADMMTKGTVAEAWLQQRTEPMFLTVEVLGRGSDPRSLEAA